MVINSPVDRKPSLCVLLNSSFFIFLYGALLGAAFFMYIFGTAVLDCTYTDWIMNQNSDITQNYLGWCMFRNSAWHFPILMDNVIYPLKESILYTDSIPLLEIFFKLLSPALPENFQYLGLYGITVYILQGGLGALIIKKIGGNAVQSTIGAGFFVLSTVLLRRIFYHPALGAHFVILLCILVCLDKNRRSLKRDTAVWAGLLCLTPYTNIYFGVMVYIFMFFRLLHDYMISKNPGRQLVIFGVSTAALFLNLFCLGAFYTRIDPQGYTLGASSLNLNGFINPVGTSRFLKDLPYAMAWQGSEGYAYTGLGIIVALVIIISFVLYNREQYKFREILKTKNTPYILLIIVSFLIAAVSPKVTLNQYKLFTYPVIKPIMYIWNSFRNTGRFSWPVMYILITFCLWWFIRNRQPKRANWLLAALLIVQFVDLSPYFIKTGELFKTKITWQSELASPAWKSLAEDYRHIFFVDNYFSLKSGLKTLYSFSDLAKKNRLTLNSTYLSRQNGTMITKNIRSEMENVKRRGPKDDTIYIFPSIQNAALYKDANIWFYSIDNIIVGLDREKSYLVDNILELQAHGGSLE